MLKGRISLPKMKWRANFLSREDLLGLDELLKTDLSLSDAFSIIKTKRNTKILRLIEGRLKEGEMIEVIFKDYLSDDLRASFEAFISYLSLVVER